MRRSTLRSLFQVLAVATLAVIAPIGGTAQAGATTVFTDDCSRYNHVNRSEQRIRIVQDAPVRSGAFETCAVRFRGPVPSADLHCYVKNEPYGNYWWFVSTDQGRQGWVYEKNFAFIPARDYPCPF